MRNQMLAYYITGSSPVLTTNLEKYLPILALSGGRGNKYLSRVSQRGSKLQGDSLQCLMMFSVSGSTPVLW